MKSHLRILLVVALGAIGISWVAAQAKPRVATKSPAVTKKRAMDQSIVVGGGCFWCLEPIFEMVKGVTAVEVGYAGGARPNVTYEQVCTGTTGHAEVLKVTFDPEKISRVDLLKLFLTIHDPTTKDRQGPDSGPQYRSVIFFAAAEEKLVAQKAIDEVSAKKVWAHPIVTTIEPLRNYTRAEEVHQDYYRKFESASEDQKMRMNAGYCRVVIEPKVRKYREKLLGGKG